MCRAFGVDFFWPTLYILYQFSSDNIGICYVNKAETQSPLASKLEAKIKFLTELLAESGHQRHRFMIASVL